MKIIKWLKDKRQERIEKNEIEFDKWVREHSIKLSQGVVISCDNKGLIRVNGILHNDDGYKNGVPK